MKEKIVDVVYTRAEIAARVAELGAQINAHYSGEPLVALCVLKGAFIFFADLVRHLSSELEIDFVRASSYGCDDKSCGTVQLGKDVELSLAGKHVLLVEDIVDTGYTMKFLVEKMVARGAKSVCLCSLIDKAERREVEMKVDFAGFSLCQGFVVGYGLDYAERYRELADICILELSQD